mmetsp:Transcript_29971/g.66312  ORF Transcript_29971/g.66312 Transcript_29971/m.66312 type:complete len:235 (+) Transcript_29971:696-1400(+)
MDVFPDRTSSCCCASAAFCSCVSMRHILTDRSGPPAENTYRPSLVTSMQVTSPGCATMPIVAEGSPVSGKALRPTTRKPVENAKYLGSLGTCSSLSSGSGKASIACGTGSRVEGGLPNRGAREVRLHCLESRLNSFNLKALLAITKRSSTSPSILGCHIIAVGWCANSIRCEHTSLPISPTDLTHITPMATEDAARSYSTQYWSSDTDIIVSTFSLYPNARPFMAAVCERARPI